MQFPQYLAIFASLAAITVAMPVESEKREAEPMVEYVRSAFQVDKREAAPMVEYVRSAFQVDKRDPLVEYVRSAFQVDKRALVDEKDLVCCLRSDPTCQAALGTSLKRDIVHESELACCVASDPRCKEVFGHQE